MKKSLLAVAAMTAFAGAAHAQSSVTVYGILDVGYVGGNSKIDNNNQKQYSGFGMSAEQSSRLGFKGTEDLGGGLSAFFTIETGLNPQNSTLSTFNNRQTFVGLKKKGIGAGSVGLQYTPVFNLSSATDPGKHNGTVGNVIYRSNNNNDFIPTTSYGDVNTTGSFTNTASNALVFKSDKFAGFSGQAMYQLNNKNATQTATNTGGNTNQNGWGLNVDYAWKKLYVGAAYQSFKNETTSIATASLAANVTDNQTLVGATYDFGILKAYAQWSNRKVTSNLNSNEYLKRSAQQLGVRSFITPKIEGWASVGNGRFSAYGTGEPTVNFTGYQLGSNYWLSKRTNLYGIFGSVQNSSENSTAIAGNGASGNQYAVGVRHTF
jgi:predicted porin